MLASALYKCRYRLDTKCLCRFSAKFRIIHAKRLCKVPVQRIWLGSLAKMPTKKCLCTAVRLSFLQDVIPRALRKRACLNDREWQGRKAINRGKRRFHIVFSQEDPIFRFRLFDSRRFRSHLFLFPQEFTPKRH